MGGTVDGLDGAREGQVQAADAAAADVVLRDVEAAPERERLIGIQRGFQSLTCGSIRRMEEARTQAIPGLEHRGNPRCIAAHHRELAHPGER